MPRTFRTPSYRLHKPTGQAVVTLNGRDHYLGKHGSPESRAEYDRLVAEWLARGRTQAPPPSTPSDGLSVNEMILAYWHHAETYYRTPDGSPSLELDNVRDALRPVRKLYGGTPAREFGPLALRAIRDEMVRAGLARTTVNARVHRIRRAFRWAASVELIPGSLVHDLESVEALKRGRSNAKEPPHVEPVPLEQVEAVLPYLSRQVAAMVRLQLLTGCRTGEVIAMRGVELVRGEPNWEFRPDRHKNTWRGQARVIVLGPRARAIVAEFLKADPDAFLFDPREANAERHARRGESRRSKPTPSELARRSKKRGAGGTHHYDRRVYRQAIVRACDRAGVPSWSPLQLRHAAGTAIRARFGIEATANVLGHAKPETTLIYAERDLARAHEIMAEVG